VIVNSFVVDEFVDGCLKYADGIVSSGKKGPLNGDGQNLEKDLDDKEKLKVRTSKNAHLKILVLQDR